MFLVSILFLNNSLLTALLSRLEAQLLFFLKAPVFIAAIQLLNMPFRSRNRTNSSRSDSERLSGTSFLFCRLP